MIIPRKKSQERDKWSIITGIAFGCQRGKAPLSVSPSRVTLDRLPYFRALTTAEQVALAADATRHTFRAGELLLSRGEYFPYVWLVESGQVKVFRINQDGREHILRIVGAGDSVNDVAALDGGPTPANVAALTPVIAWSLEGERLRTTIRRHPDLALEVIQMLAQRTRKLAQQIEDLALYPVTARLARFLLQKPLPRDGTITRATIAAHLGTTPESLSRALRALKAQGAIRYDRSAIVIIQRETLQQIATDGCLPCSTSS